MLDDLLLGDVWLALEAREQYWPLFFELLRREHPSLTEAGLRKAQKFIPSVILLYQGIGRYSSIAAYGRGLEPHSCERARSRD